MKTNTIKIHYKRIMKKKKKRIVLKLNNGKILTLLPYLVDTINKKEKSVSIPEWYAKKEGLI